MKHSEQQKMNFFLTSIYKKAWKDKTFLKNLVKDPIETLDNFTGRKGRLPIGKVLVIEDQTNPDHIYLNIPPKPANYNDRELSEKQLDHVAGAADSFSPNSWNRIFFSLRMEIGNLLGRR